MKISTDWEHGTGKLPASPRGMSRLSIDLGPEGDMDITAGPEWLSMLNRRTGASQPSYLDPTQARAVALALLEGIALHRAKSDQPEDMHLTWAIYALDPERAQDDPTASGSLLCGGPYGCGHPKSEHTRRGQLGNTDSCAHLSPEQAASASPAPGWTGCPCTGWATL